jgi:hypothetical protein
MKVPRTIWVAWCHTCDHWLDETEDARSSANLVVDEHPDHLAVDTQREEGHRRCRVEVIPFRVDRSSAMRVRAEAPKGVRISVALKEGTATALLVRPRPRKKRSAR